ncbi:Non-LTR (Long terminal repeat) retrotransposon and domain-containing protein [Elysia marginata]|uniref:Non-LTR (Long terminal repeat) retrotransposon and domain-containing protein n=1 Tax=Elysia marginata TaxID=1093978 RepID=A0AAV4JDB2_9GAST|nr:Non-LTR (Long terminal repeat) retrotransposon and domain-containing protein [Elysia marginata]
MKMMAGNSGGKAQLSIDDNVHKYANKLNAFYSRFDKHDFQDKIKEEVYEVLNGLMDNYIVSENAVAGVFRKVDERKSGGPDILKSLILKHCSDELKSIYTVLFNLFIAEHNLPSAWKTSEIIPVPKKPKSKNLMILGQLP